MFVVPVIYAVAAVIRSMVLIYAVQAVSSPVVIYVLLTVQFAVTPFVLVVVQFAAFMVALLMFIKAQVPFTLITLLNLKRIHTVWCTQLLRDRKQIICIPELLN